MVTATLMETLRVKNTLGEGVIWDAVGAAAWWTDIDGRKLYVDVRVKDRPQEKGVCR